VTRDVIVTFLVSSIATGWSLYFSEVAGFVPLRDLLVPVDLHVPALDRHALADVATHSAALERALP